MPIQTCLCGHPRTAHEHYRRGCNCGLCRCHAYRGRRNVWANLATVGWLAGVVVEVWWRWGKPEKIRPRRTPVPQPSADRRGAA